MDVEKFPWFAGVFFGQPLEALLSAVHKRLAGIILCQGYG